MGWKQTASDYLTFSKRDRAGILGVLLILFAIYFLPKLGSPLSNENAIVTDTALLSLIDTLDAKQTAYNKADYTNYDEPVDAYQPSKKFDHTTGELFLFDPNALTPEGWQRLGLSAKTAATIQKYVSKGGSFKKADDLQKIWGLPKGFYERVAPYIRITAEPVNVPFKQNYTAAPPYEKKGKIAIVEVNSADTSALIALPGIGSKLALRITNFRDKLGGFYSVDQVKETYGVPDSTFQKIKAFLTVNSDGVKKLNINTATKDDLKMHPYLKWNLANAIVEYRNQHGAFKSVSELKKIVSIDDATFNKIAPYLSF